MVLPVRVASRREFTGSWEYLVEGAIFTSPPHPAWSGAALINREGKLVGVGSLITAAVVAVALYGLVVLVRARRVAEALLLASPVVYITAVHFPLLTEARQSLPAQPVVLLLASLAFKPEIHEREHL